MDSIYFADTDAGAPVNMTVPVDGKPVNVLGNEPVYADGTKEWVPLDFSLQLSISLVQWSQWKEHEAAAAGQKKIAAASFRATLPR